VDALGRTLVRLAQRLATAPVPPVIVQVADLAAADAEQLAARVHSLKNRIECEVPQD
jgi:hypothetical protein